MPIWMFVHESHSTLGAIIPKTRPAIEEYYVAPITEAAYNPVIRTFSGFKSIPPALSEQGRSNLPKRRRRKKVLVQAENPAPRPQRYRRLQRDFTQIGEDWKQG